MPSTNNWWKNAVCYQIWPASYKDSNGDGIGDIPGIISTLDYVKVLGTDIIWLSPMYASPQKDMGYDISDYEDIYPPYGTMEDMDALIKEVHARKMRLILDLVINHTSDQHAWFQESKKSKDNDKADWYIWKPPKYVDGKRKPPNNWRASFGGSVWEYVPERDEYYLHLFEAAQPDLNWENPVTRKAIYKTAIEFWLEKGIDGFRVDTVNLYSKDPIYPDAEVKDPTQDYQIAFMHFINGPRMHEFLKELRKEALDKYGDIMMVGECAGAHHAEVLRYVGASERELSMIFDFDMALLGGIWEKPKHELYRYSLPDMKKALMKTQGFVSGTDAWTTVFAENHDLGRSISRYATDDPRYHEKAGKLMAMMLGSLTGTLFIYQGQEIGMVNMPPSWGPEELRDIEAVRYWEEMSEKYSDDEEMLRKAMAGIKLVGRDNARTPVQWDSSPNAGFTTGKPWIRVHDNYEEVNVEAQLKNENSILAFWKRMLKLRKEHADLLVHGKFEIVDFDNTKTFTFTKIGENGGKVLAVLNFTADAQEVNIPSALNTQDLQLLTSNVDEPGNQLSAWEGRVYLAR
jgi:oligo-1,6-glucosidase